MRTNHHGIASVVDPTSIYVLFIQWLLSSLDILKAPPRTSTTPKNAKTDPGTGRITVPPKVAFGVAFQAVSPS